jgi:hypothetical protein
MKRPPVLFLTAACAVIILAALIRFVPAMPASISFSATGKNAATTEPVHQNPNPQIAPQAGAVLTAVTGNVTISRDEKVIPATRMMEIVSGDRINLAATADAEITWPHYGKTWIAGRSTVLVTETFESTDRARFMTRLQLNGGRIWTRFAQPMGPSSMFDVRIGPIIVTTREGSFGISSDGKTVQTQVTQSSVHVLHVKDRAATDADRQNGATSDVVQEIVGEAVEVVAGQKVDASIADGSISAVSPLSAADQKDALMRSADVPMSDTELDVSPTTSSSTTP